MAQQTPWGVTATATDAATGVAVSLANVPRGLTYASWIRIGNRDAADLLSVSWDGGVTFPTTIPALGFLVVEGRVSVIHVKAPAGQTAAVEVTCTQGNGD